MKIKTALLVAAAVGFSLPGVAMAQQVVGTNGAVLDGMGAGGNVQNHYIYAGPPNADVTSFVTQGIKARGARSNSVECTILGDDNCWVQGNTKRIPTLDDQ